MIDYAKQQKQKTLELIKLYGTADIEKIKQDYEVDIVTNKSVKTGKRCLVCGRAIPSNRRKYCSSVCMERNKLNKVEENL